MTTRDMICSLLTDEWQSFADLYASACQSRLRCQTHFRNSLRSMFRAGLVDRKQVGNGSGWYYAYRIKSGVAAKPKKKPLPPEPAEAPLTTPIPKGCDALSNNGREWYRASSVPTEARFARTINGQHFRRLRFQDVRTRTQHQWLPVTAAHVETAGREKWYG